MLDEPPGSSRSVEHSEADITQEAAKVKQIEAVQDNVLKRLKDSRRALEQFDKASSSRLKTAINELQMHCQLLRMVKQDMDHIYRRIRAMKKKLSVLQTDEGLAAAEATNTIAQEGMAER